MAPGAHDIYGVISTPNGLEEVLAAARQVHVWRRASLRVSGYDGSQTARLEADGVEFDSEPLGEAGQHLFNGKVTCTATEAIAFVRRVSHTLAGAGIGHRLEIYDASTNLVIAFENGGEIEPPAE